MSERRLVQDRNRAKFRTARHVGNVDLGVIFKTGRHGSGEGAWKVEGDSRAVIVERGDDLGDSIASRKAICSRRRVRYPAKPRRRNVVGVELYAVVGISTQAFYSTARCKGTTSAVAANSRVKRNVGFTNAKCSNLLR